MERSRSKKIEESKEKQPVKSNLALPDKISSGCTVLDCVLGGGYPVGKIVNLVGDKSSGKTILVTEAIAKNRFLLGKSFKWFYDDAERGYTFDVQKMYKDESFSILPPDNYQSDLIEDFECRMDQELKQLKKNEILLYALDTFDHLSSKAASKRYEKHLKAAKEGEKEKGSYKTEKVINFTDFFRNRAGKIKDKNCLPFIISQVRQNIGVLFGEKYYRTGGEALNHYAAQIIWLAEVEKILKNGLSIGIVTKARTTKNKTGKAFRHCFVSILWDYGIDDLSTSIDYLFDLRDARGKTKTGQEIKWKGKEYTGKESLVKYIEKYNQEEELRQAVIDKWNRIEEEITPKRKDKYKI